MAANDTSQESQAPSSFRTKRIGGYLVDAGLLTPAQVNVVLDDQKVNGLRFGEILAARGWVKQETIEYLMEKVILPEQASLNQQDTLDNSTHQSDDMDTL
ncbi:MAG: hypothetical protein DCF22_04810 [Leptolyngbya sp.]|nr:MAG: hypothetical protein DCF22_04810 [Leptolyngbya sp.]